MALIVLVNHLSRRLWVAVLAGTMLLGLWCGHPILPGANSPGITGIAWARLSSINLLLLLAVVFQVIWLSSQMSKTGIMSELVAAVQSRVSQRMSMAMLPAVIGWLPMPGGALFSAPLVDKCDIERNIQPLLKTKTNHWFRHIWEYWWPIYPGVLLAIAESGLEIWQFVLVELPLSLFAIAGGWWFLLRRIKPASARPGKPAPSPMEAASNLRLLRLISPIVVVIAMVIAMETGIRILLYHYPWLHKPNRYLPMMTGICAAMLYLNRWRPLTWKVWKEILVSGKTIRLVILVALVRVLGAIIDADLPGGAGLVDTMRAEFAAWHIPTIAVIMLIPFLSGISTGLAIGFVGASFPIVMKMLPHGAPINEVMATTVLAYACGHYGMMLSPLHICLVATNEHFGTRLVQSMRGLIGPGLVVVIGALGMYLLIGGWN